MALSFNGGDYYSLGSITPKANGITYSLWVDSLSANVGASNHWCAVSISAITNDPHNSVVAVGDWTNDDNSLGFFYNDGSWHDWLSNTEIPNSGWQHLAVTYDGSNIRFYLNGAADGAPAHTGSLPVGGTQLFRIAHRGAVGADNDYHGYMAEVAYWERALSAAEIAGLAKGFSPLFYPKPKAYAPMIRSLIERMEFRTWTATGSTSVVAHPSIIYPAPPQVFMVPAVVAGVSPTSTLYGPLVGPLGGPI